MFSLYICPNDFRAYLLINKNKNSHFIFEDMINNKINYYHSGKIKILDLNKFFFLQKDFRFLICTFFLSLKVITMHNCSKVIINNFYLSFILLLINKFYLSTKIYILTSDKETKFSKNLFKNFFIDKIFQFNLKNAEKILVDNNIMLNFVKKKLSKELQSKILIISHAYNKKLIKSKDTKKNFIVFFGNLNQYNNINIIIDNLSQINQKFNLKLLVIGDDIKFKKFYSNLHPSILKNIVFSGFIENQNLINTISNCLIGINFTSSIKDNHSSTCTSRLSLYLNSHIPFIYTNSIISANIRKKFKLCENVNTKNLFFKIQKILNEYDSYSNEILKFSKNYHLNKIPLEIILNENSINENKYSK